jgi:hypothetical protein
VHHGVILAANFSHDISPISLKSYLAEKEDTVLLTENRSSDEMIIRLNKKVRNLTIFLISISVLLILSTVSLTILGWRRLSTIEKNRDDIEFGQFVTDFNVATDYVQPTVNTIQFLRRGYSIDFDSVNYTQDGLVLSGTVGNSTNLWVSSLALDMTARPYPYKIKDKWLQGNRIPWWPDDWNIGRAQATVGSLNPGSTAMFHITIPNVKQTPDGIQIAVSFSGERYAYFGK